MAETHDEMVDELVDKLGCSIAEAEQILIDDKKIDRGQAVDFGLTKEQERAALKSANVKTHRKPAVYKFDKKERKELHAKKNGTRKLTAVQTTNEGIKEQILAFMENGKAYTVTEIQKGVGLESNQKASALIRQLREAELVTRNVTHANAYFTKA